VGAHRKRLPQRVGGLLRAERDHDDLGVRVTLQAQRFLDRVRVEVVQRPPAGAGEPLRAGVEPRMPLRDVFHADRDLHAARDPTEGRAAPGYMRCLSASTSATKTLLTLYRPVFLTARSP